VEFQDGFWTLKRWSGLDKRMSGGLPSFQWRSRLRVLTSDPTFCCYSLVNHEPSGQNFKPGVPSSYSSVMTDLSEERIAEYTDSLQRLIPEVVQTFDELAAQVNASPPAMLWRTMPFTPEQNYWVSVSHFGFRNVLVLLFHPIQEWKSHHHHHHHTSS
jgi:hypothetical protein